MRAARDPPQTLLFRAAPTARARRTEARAQAQVAGGTARAGRSSRGREGTHWARFCRTKVREKDQGCRALGLFAEERLLRR